MVKLFSSERLEKILPEVEGFLETEVYPKELSWLKSNFFSVEPELNSLRSKIKKKGLWLPHLGKDHGGLGLTLVEFAQVSEMLGRSPFGHYLLNCQAPDIGNTELLLEFGSEHHKSKYLKPLLDGEIRSCFGMTEPDLPGSNPIMMGTKAELKEDIYLISGHKWFTSSADGAEFCIVMCVTGEGPNPYENASMIIVPTKTKGFNLVRNIPIMGEEGSGYFSHAEVKLENCEVPKENLIGSEGMGFRLAQERLGPGRIHHCMRWIGICERALDLMCKRAAERDIAPGKKLGTKQTIQNWIAESRASIDAARLMVLHTAHAMQANGQRAVRQEISTIKFFVSDVLMKVLDKAIQVHGALGITDDTILSFWYRHERGSRIYDGPDEVHKAVLAKRLLRKYGLELK